MFIWCTLLRLRFKSGRISLVDTKLPNGIGTVEYIQSGCNLVIPHGFVRYPDSNMNPLQKMGKIIWYIDRSDTGKVDLAESKNLVSFHTWSFLLSQIYSYWYLSHANTYFFLRHHVTYFDLPKPIQEGVIIWMCKIQFFFLFLLYYSLSRFSWIELQVTDFSILSKIVLA